MSVISTFSLCALRAFASHVQTISIVSHFSLFFLDVCVTLVVSLMYLFLVLSFCYYTHPSQHPRHIGVKCIVCPKDDWMWELYLFHQLFNSDATGKSPGSQEVKSFTRTTSLSTASMILDASVSHGETVYSVVRCFNYAGLQSTLVSSGVVIVTEPPDVSMATLNIIISSASYYASQDNHQVDRHRLVFGWEGIQDKSGISDCEVECYFILLISAVFYFTRIMSSLGKSIIKQNML